MAAVPHMYRHESGVYRVLFRFPVDGQMKQFHKSLKTVDERKAEGMRAKIHETLEAIERGFVEAPSEACLWDFLLSGGKANGSNNRVKRKLTLAELFERYETELPRGALEDNTMDTFRIHKAHLLRVLGDKSEVEKLRPSDHIKARSEETWRGKLITSCTIKKELGTLRAVCNWAAHQDRKYLEKVPAFTGLVYSKASGEKERFVTWDEIEAKVKRGASETLWDCLFLDPQQIDECLDFVRTHAEEPFVYPMFCFVGKTSARRSEMARARIEDFDLDKGEGILREKKRDKKVKETRRRVILPPSLVASLRDWLKVHPGGPHLFCLTTTLKKLPSGHTTGKLRAKPEPLTLNLARYYFEKTLEGSKWAVVKGFHTFRHSWASNMAAAGVDQRIIDELMGHQTEAMRKRYRHLFPAQTRAAVVAVYK